MKRRRERKVRKEGGGTAKSAREKVWEARMAESRRKERLSVFWERHGN